MVDNYPKFLYKYRSIPDNCHLKSCLEPKEIPSLDALFNSYAVFTSRKKFNDIFDSKIDFLKPSVQQLKDVRNNAKKISVPYLNQFFKKGKITEVGNNRLIELEKILTDKINSYLFFCASACNTSNLMWSHYANRHTGFCIEFRTEKLSADKVTYQKNIPQIALSDCLAVNNSPLDGDHIGKAVWNALRIKLLEWEYEKEYRFQLSSSPTNNPIKIDEFSSKMKYDADFVESIIFGCRTEEPIKQFIADNMPYPVKFKEAIEEKSTIKIVDSTIKPRAPTIE